MTAAAADPKEALRLAREEAALADLSSRGRLEVTGADRIEFLHGQSTSDVKGLAVGSGQETAFLTGKGKLRGAGTLHVFADRVLLRLDGAAMAPLRAHLEGFIIMEDVRIEDVTAATGEVGVLGAGAAAALQAELGLSEAQALAEHAVLTRAGMQVVRTASGFSVIAGRGEAMALLGRLGERLPVLTPDLLETLRVEGGVAAWGAELDPEIIPIEAGLEAAISYSKGCYTGNEVMARIRTYGHVNRRLVGLLSDAEVEVGARVLAGDGRAVGHVTSALVSPTLGRPVALAMLRREQAEAGREVAIEGGGAPVKALVTELPFVRRKA